MAHYKGVANDESFEDVKKMARCALNPVTMNGGKYVITPCKKPKRIAVVGGGVGGMETARIATLRGHHVEIFEKSSRLGGVFVEASTPSFKENDRRLLDWYKKQIADLNIPVHFNHEIKDISTLDFDEVVIATGSVEKHLHFSGAEKTISALDYLAGRDVGQNVVIIGGGLTGCEIAYDLFLKGKTPKIIEAKDDLIATRGVCLANSSYLRDFFETKNVEVHLESFVKSVEDSFVVIADKNGNESRVSCDNVIVSIGYNPNPIAKPRKHVHVVGDADKVGNLRTVVWRAWEVAEKI